MSNFEIKFKNIRGKRFARFDSLVHRGVVGFGHSIDFFGLNNYFINFGYETNYKKLKPYTSIELGLISYFYKKVKFGLNAESRFFYKSEMLLASGYLNFQLNTDHELLFNVKTNNFAKDSPVKLIYRLHF